MREIVLERQDDFEGWRDAARRLAEASVPPADVTWRVEGEAADLFVSADGEAPPPERRPLRVPRRFVDLAEWVVCHRDRERFALLYRVLCRLQDEPKLLDITTDDDVFRIEMMAKAVRRDRHKMTAFVRFRELSTEDGPRYLAWFEPDHHIVRLAAPFFVERFRSMRWSIITRDASVSWDLGRLAFGLGGAREDVPAQDATEDAWRTYYAHIFNPARLKVDAMKREMPVKYWKNLPEAPLIAPLIRSAGDSEAAMVKRPQTEVPKRAATILARSASKARPEAPAAAGDNGLDALRREAMDCQRCDLYRFATQTVFGEGKPDADLVFVGEQPGDKEDLAGRPFVGPAGVLFDRALAEADIDRKRAYVTNAVKHFKFEPRGKRRIHKKPGAGEIEACHAWLEQELAILRPRLVIALGATAIRALTGKSASVLAARGQVLPSPDFGPVFVTVHPSFLLRLPDEASQRDEYEKFVADLRAAKAIAAKADRTEPAEPPLL
ncbi:MAG TPA: UdgX family uracil-DNA binding protein [Lichenihabitans sp.]|jgi:DNA polymerase|nr:UdgX family uracil-DNA binding protein [Lichenihabitans sp.]